MSEFGDSYHLRTSDTRAAVRLIRKTGRYGMVLPSSGPYTPFPVEGLDEVASPMDALVEHNEQVLIHYVFAEDHGCWIRVFEGTTAIATLSFVEAGQLQPDRRPLSINADNLVPALAALRSLSIIDEVAAVRLEDLARDVVVPEVGPKVAAALGLEQVDWLSCADLTYQGRRALRERFPDAQFVNVEQRGKARARLSFEEQMALPIPEAALDEAQEQMVRRHYRYWIEFGDWDDEAQQGFWMYEHYEAVLPTRYRYLPFQLMNYIGSLRDPDKARRVLRAIIGLIGPEVDWEPYLRGF